LTQAGTSSLAEASDSAAGNNVAGCSFTCDRDGCYNFSDGGTGACNGISVTQGPAAMETVCVGSSCVQAELGSIELQYALTPPAAMSSVQKKAPAGAGVRPSPAHFALAAHAMVYGCLSATGKLLSGEGKGWGEDFTSDSAEAADSLTPIVRNGAHVLRNAFRSSNEREGKRREGGREGGREGERARARERERAR